MSFCSALSQGSDPEGLLQRELSQDFDDINSDVEEETQNLTTGSPSHVVRRWSEQRTEQAAAFLGRVLRLNVLRRCRRRAKPLLLCASFAVVAIILLTSGI